MAGRGKRVCELSPWSPHRSRRAADYYSSILPRLDAGSQFNCSYQSAMDGAGATVTTMQTTLSSVLADTSMPNVNSLVAIASVNSTM